MSTQVHLTTANTGHTLNKWFRTSNRSGSNRSSWACVREGRAGRHRQAQPVGRAEGGLEQTGAEATRPVWEAPALLPACLKRIKKIRLCPASWGHSDGTLTAKTAVCVNLSFKQRRFDREKETISEVDDTTALKHRNGCVLLSSEGRALCSEEMTR